MPTALKMSGRVLMSMMLVHGGFSMFALDAQSREIRNTTRTNVNRHVNHNVNVRRDVDIDVDVDRRYGGYYGHPVATVAAASAAAVVTSAVVGSIVYSLPPACSAVVVNGLTYQNCSGTWYQPRYAGSQVTYVVVNPPR